MADTIPLYRGLAQAFRMEDVDTIFVLTGDGNMHWEAALSENAEVRAFHVWHEHATCAMASAYAVASGKVGVASVTCGPGVTQLMTALTTAADSRIPLVVFAGESPLHANWYLQHIDQATVVEATGAHYIGAHSLRRMFEYVQEAFYVARTERRPVVLGVPIDLQQIQIPADIKYVPSSEIIPDTGPMVPNPDYVRRAVERIGEAARIIIVAGRGARSSGAKALCEQLAERCNGLLATTLPVRGMFDGNPRNLGIAGGFSHPAARQAFSECDLVVTVGASLTHHTTDGGTLFSHAAVLQIDPEPQGIRHGQRIERMFLRADGVEGLSAVIKGLGNAPSHGRAAAWNALGFVARTRTEPVDTTFFEMKPGDLDPRQLVTELGRVLPKDWEYVNGGGHNGFFTAQMQGGGDDHFLTIREFGAIGNELCFAIGTAAAKPGKPIIVTCGDGSFMMHAQELDTMRRYDLPILVCVLNDGAYGAEIHKLRADKLDGHGSMWPRRPLANIAKGFGLNGATVTSLDQIAGLLEAFKATKQPTVWDFHISDQVVSPMMRRGVARRAVTT
jgi:thiamine pyrophosphate-dependent acetolactate synthase large subunit-like protein